MQSADRKPPKLVQGPESIHPAGTALVTTTDDESVNTTDTKKTNSTVSTNISKRFFREINFTKFFVKMII